MTPGSGWNSRMSYIRQEGEESPSGCGEFEEPSRQLGDGDQ